ncbi:hypothetical protein QWU11_36445 [Actinomadura sp. DC4]|nr:hypothetical protein [Actinomadura sp. DC4]
MNATTDGVVRDPSLFGTTAGWPSTIAAITEFVVPRSIPAAFGMTHLHSDLPDPGARRGRRDSDQSAISM